MQVTVRFFAGLRDMAGTKQAILDVAEGTTLDHLVAQLVKQFPALDGKQAAFHFAVNHTHVEADTPLQDGDRVAIFPYIAGG